MTKPRPLRWDITLDYLSGGPITTPSPSEREAEGLVYTGAGRAWGDATVYLGTPAGSPWTQEQAGGILPWSLWKEPAPAPPKHTHTLT